MRRGILFAPEAASDLKSLSARDRAIVRDAIEQHLRHRPRRISKNRIKRLRGISRPQFRLRVGEIRVFYDVTDKAVEVLAIVPKSRAAAWLDKVGEEEA
jgi:mRNA-degrading endonuclease RelE of RelBE toxin-antitoxin system